jgi:hypothetical protein
MSQPVYEVIDVGGRRTMVATQDLLPGAVVFQEHALMLLTHAEVQRCVGRTKPKFERYLAVYDLFNKKLSAKQQFAFQSLAKPIYPHFEVSLRSIANQTFKDDGKARFSEEETKLYMKLVCIERNCSFNGPAGDATIESATRMTHSCSPNCYLDIVEDYCTCRVIMPVKAGEPLTIEYKPSVQTLSTADRRHHYIEFKDFTCHCPRCDAPGDDTRQFNCFDAKCAGRHLVCQPLSDRKLHYPETRYDGVEYVEPHLLPCTVCKRSPPLEYQTAMFELEHRLPAIYQSIAAKHKKVQAKSLNNAAAQRALLQEIEATRYPPWHALGLSLAITELSERQILFLQGAPEQKEKIWRLGQQIEATIGSILNFPTPFASELTSLIASGYMSTAQHAQAREHTLRGLRMHLILRGRESHRSDLTGIMLELFRDLPLTLAARTTVPSLPATITEPTALATEVVVDAAKASVPTVCAPSLPDDAPSEDSAGPVVCTSASSTACHSTVTAAPYDTTICAYCEESPLRAALKLSLCGRCRQAAYCGSACQKAHWKAHRSRCPKS